MKTQTTGPISPPKTRRPYTPPQIRKIAPEDAARLLSKMKLEGKRLDADEILQPLEEMRMRATSGELR